jgi:hypothetical protein
MDVSIVTLKHGLILFWALWMTVVVLNNLGDGLRVLGLVPETFPIHSGNYSVMRDVMAKRRAPDWSTKLLFAGVILWEIIIAYLLWRAVFDLTTFLIPAFGANLALWAAFMIADEVFVAYEVEATHLRIFTAQIVTLLFILLTPILF